jgi:hypothetical protein
MSPRGKRVTASQVGQYAYCARAWWLGVVEKHPPAGIKELKRGRRVHERHGWRISIARLARRVAFLALGAAALSALVWAAGELL